LLLYLSIPILAYFAACAALISVNGRINSRIYFSVAAFMTLLFIVLYGLRGGDSGADTHVYLSAFQNHEYSWGWGFSLLTYLVHFFTESNAVYLFSIAFLSLWLIFSGAFLITEKDEKNLSLLILITFYSSFYFFDILTNVLRQGVGLSLCFFGIALYFRNLKLLSIVLILVAVFFHKSIFVLVILFLIGINLAKYKFVKKNILFFSCVMFFLSVVGVEFFAIAVEALNSLSRLPGFSFISIITESMTFYAGSAEGSFSALNSFGATVQIISILVPALLYHYAFYRVKYKYDSLYILYNLLVCFYAIVMNNSYSFRYTYLFLTLSPLLLVFSVNKIAGARYYKVVMPAYVMVCSLYFLLRVVLSENAALFSYDV